MHSLDPALPEGGGGKMGKCKKHIQGWSWQKNSFSEAYYWKAFQGSIHVGEVSERQDHAEPSIFDWRHDWRICIRVYQMANAVN